MAERLDLVVIGAGPGGYVAAIRAAQLGMKVACVEKEPAPGGTCLRVGCIPSKALLDSSQLYREVREHAAEHGVRVGGVELDLATMMERKAKVVADLSRGIAHLFKKNGVEPVSGTARLLAPGRVEVRGEAGVRILEAREVLVATGSRVRELPALPFDGSRVITSTEALSLTKVPEHLVVLGAGAIGLELGSVWARLGARVTVVEAEDRILPTMDRELTRILQRSLEKQGLAFRLATFATGRRLEGNGVVVGLRGRAEGTPEEELAGDVLLVAIGRVPNTEGLGLEDLGIELDRGGRVVVDGEYRTRVPGVWAIGDVIAGPMLAHKAEEEGMAAVQLMAGQHGRVRHETIPGVVYTHPELAQVGLTEEEARERHGEVRVGRFPFAASGRARAMGDVEGMVKLIAHPRTDRILGIHILGARAADMIAEGVLAMELSASSEDLALTCHAHPNHPQALKEAALAALGRGLHT